MLTIERLESQKHFSFRNNKANRPKQYNKHQVSSPIPEVEESSWLCSQPGAIVAVIVW